MYGITKIGYNINITLLKEKLKNIKSELDKIEKEIKKNK